MMIQIKDVIESVENHYHLVHGSIVEYNRRRITAEARAVAMFLARKLTRYSWPELGDAFYRDHATVIHNHNRVLRVVDYGDSRDEMYTAVMAIYGKFKLETPK